MKLRDLFVPRWDHSDPMVRNKAVERLKNIDPFKQIAGREDHPMVWDTALEVLDRLAKEQVRVSE